MDHWSVRDEYGRVYYLGRFSSEEEATRFAVECVFQDSYPKDFGCNLDVIKDNRCFIRRILNI